MSTSARVSMDPIAVARWTDVVLVIAAAPFVAIQGIFSAQEDTRDKALVWAQKAVERNEGSDPTRVSIGKA